MIRLADFSYVILHAWAKQELAQIQKKSEELEIFAQLAVIEKNKALPLAARNCGRWYKGVRMKTLPIGKKWEVFLVQRENNVEVLMVAPALDHFSVVEFAQQRFESSVSKSS